MLSEGKTQTNIGNLTGLGQRRVSMIKTGKIKTLYEVATMPRQ